MSSSTLLYTDHSNGKPEVHSTDVPQLKGKRLMLDYSIVVNILAVKCSKKGIFIASGREQGLTICHRKADGPKRRIVSGKLSGMEKELDAFGTHL